MSWKCPSCDEIIESLDYEVSTSSYEYGTASLSDEKYEDSSDIVTDHDYNDSGDTEWSGDAEYKCPECNDEISPTSLIWINDDDDEEEKEEEEKKEIEEETKHEIIKPSNYIICDDEPKDTSNSSVICKECNYVFCVNGGKSDWNEGGEELFHECPQCGTSNTLKEYKQLLLSNFFITKLKENDNKKLKPRSIKSMDKPKLKVHCKISRFRRISKKIPSKKNKRNR